VSPGRYRTASTFFRTPSTKAGLEWLRGMDLELFETHDLRTGRILLIRGRAA
jgi:hypothetical protein